MIIEHKDRFINPEKITHLTLKPLLNSSNWNVVIHFIGGGSIDVPYGSYEESLNGRKKLMKIINDNK